MQNKLPILLFSGGMDSLIAWYYLGKPACVYVDLGHRYNWAEKDAIKKIQETTDMKVTIDNRLFLGDLEQPDAFISLRNAFLGLVGALYSDYVWLVVQKGELALEDRSELFFNQISALLTGLTKNPKARVWSPFFHLTKTEMVKWYVLNKHPISVLLDSSSCYQGTNCGECAACFRRWVSLSLNGVEDTFLVNPWSTKIAGAYLIDAASGKYGADRGSEVLTALRKAGVK